MWGREISRAAGDLPPWLLFGDTGAVLAGDFLYLDESGDTGLGPRSTPYFAIAVLFLRTESALSRVMRRAHKKVLGRGARVTELKWSSSSDELRRAVIDQICKEGHLIGGIAAAVMEKTWINAAHAQRKEYTRYNFCARLALEKGGLFSSGAAGRAVSLVIDGRNRRATEAPTEYMGLLECSGELPCSVGVKAKDSCAVPQLQAVDFLAGAVCAAFIRGDWSYYKLLRGASVQIEVRMLRGKTPAP